MTVPAAVTTYRYEGNGVTTVFAYSNRLLTTADVEVKILTRATDAEVETLVLTTDYTVTIVSNSLANITITNPVKIPSGTQDILLSLNLAITQTRSFPRADSLPAADIELGLDKLTLVAQLLNDAQTRSLRFPESDTTTSGLLPAKAARALSYLAFDANGVPIVSSGTGTTTPISSAMTPVVSAATLAAARTAMGVAASGANTDITSLASATTVTTQSVGDNSTKIASTAFVLANSGATGKQDFRLTLTTGLPVTTAGVTAATTIFCTPYKGNQIGLYDGTRWAVYTSAQFSLALGTLAAARMHDVFCYLNAGVPTLEFTIWASDTARATALAYQDGVLVRSGAPTRRYLGSFLSTTTTQTEDSTSRRYLWNYYNRVPRTMSVFETIDTWTYTTATWRAANGSSANRLNFAIGVAEDAVLANVKATALNTSVGIAFFVGVGLDVTNALSAGNINTYGQCAAVSVPTPVTASWIGIPAAGAHFLSWIEYSVATGTCTWFGDNGGAGPGLAQSGITGVVWA